MKNERINKLVGAIGALGFFVLLVYFIVSQIGYEFNMESIIPYGPVMLKGFGLTVLLSVLSLFFSIIVGLIFYFMKESKIYLLRYIAKVITEVMFGSPLLVLVVILYYFAASAFGINNKLVAAVMILTLYNASYISEIYRGGMESIPQSQWKAAKVFGFSRVQTYRYIIMPQVFRNILPPLTGQLALLVKSTSLLSFMAVNEFFNVMAGVNANTFRFIEGYIVLAIGYLIITIPLSIMIKFLEKKVKVIS